jgi:predicted NBD/HSP70 family sugar kinase
LTAPPPAAGRFFTFVQWEFPGRLGPDPGRYVLRSFAGDPAHHVLVIETGEAPRRRRFGRGGRARRAEPESAPVDVTRATVIAADAVEDAEAAEWLNAAGERAEEIVADALAVLNHALHAHRVAAADPYAGFATRAAAQATRIGYGTGEQVADSRWEAAVELPPSAPPRRARALSPQERLAALLSGRDVALACEELALRARLDLDTGREREAALQLRAALEAALAELAGWRDVGGIAGRLDELRGLAPGVDTAARAALEGGLAPEDAERVRTTLERLEAALRARSAAGQGRA